ncbi:MAG: hypothetical protein PVF65_06910, partial [Sphingomonadales bacterium]
VPMGADGLFQSARHYAELLWSSSAFADSLMTVFTQFQSGTSNVTGEGFNPASDFKAFVENNGPQIMFAAKEKDYLKDLSGKPKRIQWPTPGENPDWRAVHKLIQWAEASNVELIFFTHPYHVSLLEAFDRKGLWPAFEAWKIKLTTVADRWNIPLWDFAVVSDETLEAVPSQDSMAFYWEAGHYKAELGDRMVVRMRGGEGFGFKLKSEYVQDYLALQRKQLLNYRGAHPEDARRNQDQSAARKSMSELATK